jgi:hypothetical protein
MFDRVSPPMEREAAPLRKARERVTRPVRHAGVHTAEQAAPILTTKTHQERTAARPHDVPGDETVRGIEIRIRSVQGSPNLPVGTLLAEGELHPRSITRRTPGDRPCHLVIPTPSAGLHAEQPDAVVVAHEVGAERATAALEVENGERDRYLRRPAFSGALGRSLPISLPFDLARPPSKASDWGPWAFEVTSKGV